MEELMEGVFREVDRYPAAENVVDVKMPAQLGGGEMSAT